MVLLAAACKVGVAREAAVPWLQGQKEKSAEAGPWQAWRRGREVRLALGICDRRYCG